MWAGSDGNVGNRLGRMWAGSKGKGTWERLEDSWKGDEVEP